LGFLAIMQHIKKDTHQWWHAVWLAGGGSGHGPETLF
jgi:hypothetical protein